MNKKTLKNEVPMAGRVSGVGGGKGGIKPVDGGAKGGGESVVGDPGIVADAESLEVRESVDDMPSISVSMSADDRRFALFVARISTIDRYHVPITEKGLPAAYRTAYQEAIIAERIYSECEKVRCDNE